MHRRDGKSGQGKSRNKCSLEWCGKQIRLEKKAKLKSLTQSSLWQTLFWYFYFLSNLWMFYNKPSGKDLDDWHREDFGWRNTIWPLRSGMEYYNTSRVGILKELCNTPRVLKCSVCMSVNSISSTRFWGETVLYWTLLSYEKFTPTIKFKGSAIKKKINFLQVIFS